MEENEGPVDEAVEVPDDPVEADSESPSKPDTAGPSAENLIPPLPEGEEPPKKVLWPDWAKAHTPLIIAATTLALVGLVLIVRVLLPASAAPLTQSVEWSGIAVNYPEGWKEDAAQEDGSELLFYLHPDFDGLVMIQINTLEGPLDDKEAEGYIDGFTSSGEYRVTDGLEKTDIDGRRAYRFSFEATLNKTDYQGSGLIVDLGATMATVMGATANGASQTDKSTMEAVMNSLRVVDTSKAATVTFMDGDSEVESEELAFFGTATVKAPEISKEKAVLTGWKVTKGHATVKQDGNAFKVIGISDDVTLEAEWTPTWVVTFTDGEGNVLSEVNVRNGDAATAPKAPTREGYDFAGWDGSYMNVTADVEIKATWAPVWTVTFTDGQGNVLSEVNVRNGGSATPPKNPARSGYTFAGWEVDYSNVTGNVEIKAKWDKLPTLGEKNALSSAQAYLRMGGFSHSRLIEQLEFEGFSNSEATYAADHCGADWNEQAAQSAASYMKLGGFSRNRLIEQLKFEGFTTEQAEYGAKSVGY